jgi:hypothetical protein
MRYKATVSFSGKISASKGKVIEISDSALADDLLKAGYIIPFEADKPKAEPKGDKPKTTKRKGNKNES